MTHTQQMFRKLLAQFYILHTCTHASKEARLQTISSYVRTVTLQIVQLHAESNLKSTVHDHKTLIQWNLDYPNTDYPNSRLSEHQIDCSIRYFVKKCMLH